MSITETVLIFVGIPAAVIALIYILVFTGSARRARRYRPGRPFEFRPVWFLSAPERHGPQADERGAIGAGDTRAALAAGHGRAPAGGPVSQDVTGGASDRW